MSENTIAADSADLARRAKAFYESHLRAELEPTHPHEFVAIEPDSGDYFLGPTLTAAVSAAREAHPDRLSFVLRVGHATALDLGGLSR